MKKKAHGHKHHMAEHAKALKLAAHHHKEGMKSMHEMVKSEKKEGKAIHKAAKHHKGHKAKAKKHHSY